MNLSSRTFGVEFELFFEEEDWDKLLKANSKYLKPPKEVIQDFRDDYEYDRFDDESMKAYIKRRTKEYIENIDDFECYDLVQEIIEDRLKLDGWNIHDDCSIEGGHITMEIVTPILKGKQGLKDITKFLNYFKKYASVNESCGLHVHVGAEDFIKARNNTELFASALLYYSSFESLFDSMVINDRRNDYNEFAQPTLDAHQIITERQHGNKGNKIQYERYSKVNLCSIDVHRTIEFRHMHGVLDPRVVTNWVKVCTAYVDMVKEHHSEWSDVVKFKPNKNQKPQRDYEFDFHYEGLDILVQTAKRKVASKRGYPKGLPVTAINTIRKVNKELFGIKMAA